MAIDERAGIVAEKVPEDEIVNLLMMSKFYE
jgi:hypothetical protein